MSDARTVSLFSKLKKAQRLPSPPGAALRVLELCRANDTGVREIADAIMADPVLAGRLLRYANSAIVGASREVASVRDAVLFLGLRAVKLAALGFSLASTGESSCRGFSLKAFWTDSIVTAILARRLAGHFNTDREEAFTAGLLAGIGRLALAQGLPEKYAGVQQATGPDRAALIDEERKHLGTDHLEFGGELLVQWEVPAKLVQAIVYYMRPAEADDRARPLAEAIQVAVRLSPLFLCEGDCALELRRAARGIIEGRLKLSEQAWQSVAEEVLADYHQFAEVLNIELDQASVFDLYAEAQEEAIRVGLVAQLEKSRALEENKDLLKRATMDALTQIANRARFDERIGELIAGVARGHGDFALVLFDIDHFKQFNDRHGHAVGDLVLKRVAQIVQSSLRDVDLFARYGGEEFTILAPQTDQRGACIIAARTRKRVEDLRVEADGQTLRVTISLGLVLSSDYRQVPTSEQILVDADKQLYLSKLAGRNTWSYQGRCASQFARPAVSA